MQTEWLILIIPLSYYIISTIFLCCPLFTPYRYANEHLNSLLTSESIFCISHRGGGFQKPQNTLEAFSNADSNSDMFQLDVHLTKDNQLVVHHDATLLRTCGLNQEISSLNYDELPTFQPIFQTFGNGPMPSTGNKIPLLRDLFKAYPTKLMNIELKNASEAGAQEFGRLIRQYDRERYTIWGVAGKVDISKSNLAVSTFYSAGEVCRLYLLFLFGLLPFACIRHGVLDIPLITEQMETLVNRVRGWKSCLLKFALCLGKCFNCLSRLFIPHLRKRGILTFYWIVNEEHDFERAIETGCKGIMTDEPSRLKKYLISVGRQYLEDSL